MAIHDAHPHGNATVPPGADFGKPQSESRHWFEPLLVLSIMIASLYFNRDRSASLRVQSSRTSSPSLSPRTSFDDRVRKPRRETEPLNFGSRLLQKFPFLIEMFYWFCNFVVYSLTKELGAWIYSFGNEDHRVTKIAQQHGIDILTFEHHTFAKLFLPVSELEFQHFFLNGHGGLLTVLNQIYSLVHIPGTVAFLSWSYHALPTHDAFTLLRRTMCLGNFTAFAAFCLYPCMPPRLLPKSFGFVDTVRQGHAESVWAGGANVNQLAAMPSLHFTYAFIIGCTFLAHSGVWSAFTWRNRTRTSASGVVRACGYLVAGVAYPLLVLTVIVATANHYFLDAVAATLVVLVALACNRVWLVLLPAERVLLRVLRLRKPVPPVRRTERERGRGSEEPLLVDYA